MHTMVRLETYAVPIENLRWICPQDVMIPILNVRNLMLREDVVQAIKDGNFHIYAVMTIDQGIEILTGVMAGERQPDGTFPEGTVNYLVDKHLREYAERLKGYDMMRLPDVGTG